MFVQLLPRSYVLEKVIGFKPDEILPWVCSIVTLCAMIVNVGVHDAEYCVRWELALQRRLSVIHHESFGQPLLAMDENQSNPKLGMHVNSNERLKAPPRLSQATSSKPNQRLWSL